MNKILIFSIILISFSLTAQKMGKLKDKRDGKIYPTVVIGSQTWMAENLNAATFRNGDPIPEVKSKEEWEKAVNEKRPAWCYYDNNPSNAEKYGKLYNWYAVIDSRGLAPEGWRISSVEDWRNIAKSLGGVESAGKKMKSKTGWAKKTFGNKNSGNGNNKSNFNGFPGGLRSINGSYMLLGNESVWWSKLEPSNYLWLAILKDCCDYIEEDKGLEIMGCSVRCVKE